MPRLVGELDDACAAVARRRPAAGARVWVVSEYGHVPVEPAVLLNRVLRQAGLLAVRAGPFGEKLDTFDSRAFAVCDHQLAHVYVSDASRRAARCEDYSPALPGVARAAGRRRAGGDRPAAPSRAGELVALSEPDAWFAYPYWLDDRLAPDFARTVDIHRKPGYDPCELFFDPNLRWPKGRAAAAAARRRSWAFALSSTWCRSTRRWCRAATACAAADAADRPLLIGDGPVPSGEELPMTAVRDLVLAAMELAE